MTGRRRCAIIFKNSIFVSEPAGLKALPMGGRTTALCKRRLRVGEETLPLSVFEKETAGHFLLKMPISVCALRTVGRSVLSNGSSLFFRKEGVV